MKLSKLEQESIILYNEEEPTASIYTHDPKLIRKLKRLAEKYPDKVYPDKAVHAGAVSYPRQGRHLRHGYAHLKFHDGIIYHDAVFAA